MEKYVIKGGVALKGEVEISGGPYCCSNYGGRERNNRKLT